MSPPPQPPGKPWAVVSSTKQALVSPSLCYHFEMTMNSGTWWTIWKTQISQKKREKRNEVGVAEILPFNDNCPHLTFW